MNAIDQQAKLYTAVFFMVLALLIAGVMLVIAIKFEISCRKQEKREQDDSIIFSPWVEVKLDMDYENNKSK